MKKLITLLIALFIFNSSFLIHNCQSQWVQMSNGMGNNKDVYSTAVSGTNIFAGSNGSIYLSTNNGTSWTQTTFNASYVYSLAVSGNNVFAGSNGVYITTNNGANWTQTAFNSQDVHSLAVSGNNVLAGTYNTSFNSGVYLSTNNGTNWIQTLTNQNVIALAVSSNKVFAGSWYSLNVYSCLHNSTNNGANWAENGFNNQTIRSIAISGNNVFVGATQDGVCLSTDNGSSWTQTALHNNNVYALVVYGNNVFAGTGDSGIYLTTNNGINWIQKNQGFNFIPSVRALFITNNFIFVGGAGYSVWRRSLSEIIVIQNINTKIPLNFKLEQNYPNPFNPVTKISFDMPKEGKVKLVIYDILGREIKTLLNNEIKPVGKYIIEYNAEGLSSGIYFYRILIDEGKSYRLGKKMVYIK